MSARTIICAVAILCTASAVRAATPTPAELDQRRQWVAAKFEGKGAAPDDRPYLLVVENHDPVQKNARANKPLKLGATSFTRGLFCHASSRVVLKNAPAGAATFSAMAGVDSNEQTTGGRGSVVFTIEVDGKQQFKSDLMRENTPAVNISLPLNSAKEMALIVTDGGDGISCDQADWADAKITTAGGEIIWLGDLPIRDSAAPHQGIARGPLFSFILDGKPSADAMRDWSIERSSEKVDEHRTRRTIISRQPGAGLVVQCVGVEYDDFPTVEWTVFIKNEGKADSPIIEQLQAIDTTLYRDQGSEFVLHHSNGSPANSTDYEPRETRLGPRESKHLATSGGRPTNSEFPYFNIEWGGRGAIVVLGWPGQWAASFVRDSGGELRVVGGQELTHFRLHAGEEIRTPLVAMQFYEGDAVRAQNVWRQWMIAHNIPRTVVGGVANALPPPMLGACSSHQMHEMINADEQSQITFIDGYLDRGIKLDYWWMDAGWYINSGDWPNTGTWTVDPKRFPRGLRAITDHMHSRDVKSIVWFEPERVNPGTDLYEKHPDFLLGKDGGDKLLNLGNDDARKWWVDRADGIITAQGIDLYRTDYNIDPLPFWRANDAEDRQGITENKYAVGFLAYLDELQKRHPGMLIDTCASGGRRNDLETLRRAVPLLRSDSILEPVAQQNHTMGIASWIPYYGTGVNDAVAYNFRSQMCPWTTACYDVRRKDLDYDTIRKLVGQWREISKYYYGDFYRLTPYAAENTAWIAWQFHDPKQDAGFVQAFRRADSIYESAGLKLNGVDPAATYVVTNLDDEKSAREVKGKDLAAGLSIAMKHQPDSALITYKRK